MGLEAYVPQPRSVQAGGTVVQVLPLRIRQIPQFVRCIGPSLEPIARGQLLAAVTAGGEQLVQALAIATGQTEEWVGELLPDEFLQLFSAVVEVNGDFFVQRVMPALTEATNATAATLGATPSPS